MKSHNISNATINWYIDNIELFSDIIGFYLISLVSFLGLIINLGINISWDSKILKHSFYRYLRVKVCIDIVICIISIGYLNSNCLECQWTNNNNYYQIFYQWRIIKINMKGIFMISSLHEIYLITRYLIIKNKKNWFVNIQLKCYIPSIVLIPSIMTFFFHICFEIICIEDLCSWKLSKIGNSTVSKVTLITFAIPEMFLPVIVLMIMSILVTKSYHERIGIKSKLLSKSTNKKQNKEKRITCIILLLTWLIIITRIFDALIALYLRIYAWKSISFVPVIIIRFLRQFSFLLQFF